MKFQSRKKPETPSDDFVKHHLESFTRKKGKHSWFIVCPFHADRDPSLSVVVGRGFKQRIGFWRCFGCGRKGYWNELAIALNLPTLDGFTADLVEFDSIDFVFDSDWEPKDTFICGGNSNYPRKIQKRNLIKWPDNNWRGFSGETIRQYGGNLNMLDSDYPLVFQCKQRKALESCGLILCRGKKEEGRKSYLFTDGEWTSKFLWPEHKLKPTKVMVMVEGLRDALAWICLGVPTVAILGTQTGISSKRFSVLVGLGVETIILFMDGDKAGRTAVYGTYDGEKLVKEGLKSILVKDFKVLVIKTWKEYPDEDPFSLAQNRKFVERFKKKIGALL